MKIIPWYLSRRPFNKNVFNKISSSPLKINLKRNLSINITGQSYGQRVVANLTATWPIIFISVKTYFEWQFSVFNQFKKIKSLYVRLLKLSSKSAWSISRCISCSAETLYSIFDCFPIRNIRLPSFHTQFSGPSPWTGARQIHV